MPVFAVLGAISAGASIYGAFQSYNANKEAEQRALLLGAMEAEEITRRNKENEQILLDREEEISSSLQAAGAMRGTGAGFGEAARSRSNLMRNLDIYRKEAEYKANMARMGAQNQADTYSDRATASIISGVGGVAQASMSAYDMQQKYGKQ